MDKVTALAVGAVTVATMVEAGSLPHHVAEVKPCAESRLVTQCAPSHHLEQAELQERHAFELRGAGTGGSLTIQLRGVAAVAVAGDMVAMTG